MGNEVTRYAYIAALIMLLLLSTACQTSSAAEFTPGPPATLHPLFANTSLATPTQRATQTPMLATRAAPPATAQPVLNEIDFVSAPLFDGAINEDWSLQNSNDIDYIFVNSPELLGAGSALRITPMGEGATAYFSLNETAAGKYPRSAVFGVSFKVNGGSDWLRGKDMGIAIVGSNDNDYWVAGDTSVASPFNLDPVFSETTLIWLGIDGSIPPQSWVQIEVFLDELRFDPLYEYVTAVYFKFDPNLPNPVYLKDIQLLLLPEELQEETP